MGKHLTLDERMEIQQALKDQVERGTDAPEHAVHLVGTLL